MTTLHINQAYVEHTDEQRAAPRKRTPLTEKQRDILAGFGKQECPQCYAISDISTEPCAQCGAAPITEERAQTLEWALTVTAMRDGIPFDGTIPPATIDDEFQTASAQDRDAAL